LYIELKSGAGVKAREIVSGLNVDLDASGAVGGWISIMRRERSILLRWKQSHCWSTPRGLHEATAS